MKKTLAILLSAIMILSCLAGMFAVFADEETPTTDVPEAETSSEPTAILDFSVATDNTTEAYGLSEFRNLTCSEAINSGYITLTATGGDPRIKKIKNTNIIGTNTQLLKFAVIKYRTDINERGEFFIDRADGVTMGQTGTNAKFEYIGDRQWHYTICDASEIWGTADTTVTTLRLDPFNDATDHSIDISKIVFFDNAIAAADYIAADSISVQVKGEYVEGDINVFQFGDKFYTADEWFELEEGNTEYQLVETRVYKNGIDTGFITDKAVDNRTIAYKHLIELTKQDPMDGAVTVGEKKYVYSSKTEVTEVTVTTDPEDKSAELKTEAGNVLNMWCDAFSVNNDTNINEPDVTAESYLASKLSGTFRDTKREYNYIRFFGWAYTKEGEEKTQKITAFGYALNDGDIIWDDNFFIHDEVTASVLPNSNVERYNILVDTTALEDGFYKIGLYAKGEADDIYRLNKWGNISYICGGSIELTGYTDGTNNYDLETVIYTEGEKLYALADAIDVTDGAPEGADLKSKFVYNTTLEYVNTPVIPSFCTPVYIIDGDALNTNPGTRAEAATYDYEKNCIRYTATGDDPNASDYQAPKGTVVGPWMVVKYRTECEGAKGQFFIGKTGGATGAGDEISFPYVNDNQWHTEVLNIGALKDYNNETNVINHLRNDFVQYSGQWVDIEYYAFFDTEQYARYYAEYDLHVLPKLYTATFIVDGQEYQKVSFKNGSTELTGVPQVPAKEGFTGAWEPYTVTDADFEVNAVYMPIIYTAVFKADGQEIATVEFGYNATELENVPEVPAKEGFTAKWAEYTLNNAYIVIEAVYTPITYTATFVADGETIGTVTFNHGATELENIPAVPEKEGFTGVWDEYTVGNADFTVNAVYTENTTTEAATTEAATTTEAIETTTKVEDNEGCKSVVTGALVLLTTISLAGVALNKKH